MTNEPLKLVQILGSQFSTDPEIRSREIKIALERYIRQVEPTIYESIEQRFQDNVDWDPFTDYPKPKASFLRWHRWRCYFRNKLLHFTSEKFKNTLWPTYNEVQEGPPLWRPIDEARTRKRDWFTTFFFALTQRNTKSRSMDSTMITSQPKIMCPITTLYFGNKFHYGTDLPHEMYLVIMMKIFHFSNPSRDIGMTRISIRVIPRSGIAHG